ncbi:hypothetical protein D3C84_1137480 [compost metagenome]
MFFHADEVGLLAGFQEGHAFAHFGVADNHAGLGDWMVARGIEGGDESIKVIAIDALGEPAERLPSIDDGFE